MERFLAIVNPAAGGGRCGKLAEEALGRVRQTGIELEAVRTCTPGEAAAIARNAYLNGIRNFIAVGGDGTAYEIVNGIFPESETKGRASLGFLPLGTGNSFLNDFTTKGVEHTIKSLNTGKRRACDVIRLIHASGQLYFINLLSLGFPADVGKTANRYFKSWGEVGYVLAVLMRVAGLEHRAFPHRPDGAADWDRRPCLFLAFSNSKFTGGKMMIAPDADATDGRIECVRWGAIGRLGLLWNLPRLFTGTHIEHPLASRATASRVEFELDGPVNVMIDGEILRLECQALEVLPSALDIFA
ncbi:MAG: diacylglycerol/lipid kinase family protein [Candidatus Acidiferrales bacterium]